LIQEAAPGMKVVGAARRTEPDDLPDKDPFNGENICRP
jgi:hypothetical protein